jgi:two-component system, NarL family, sensor histidine kinase DevS
MAVLRNEDGALGPLVGPLVGSHVYLIIKEALTNVLRHAEATNVVVLVTASKGRLRLEVTDDGIGLDGKARHGFPGPGGVRGLENMRRRASALGGTAGSCRTPRGAEPASSWKCR